MCVARHSRLAPLSIAMNVNIVGIRGGHHSLLTPCTAPLPHPQRPWCMCSMLVALHNPCCCREKDRSDFSLPQQAAPKFNPPPSSSAPAQKVRCLSSIQPLMVPTKCLSRPPQPNTSSFHSPDAPIHAQTCSLLQSSIHPLLLPHLSSGTTSLGASQAG